MNARIEYLDSLKAFAIFCVVLGHSIQCFDKTGVMNEVYSVIYSFHMPLFMVISGFFISKLFAMRIDRVVMQKSRQLLLPVVTFSVLAYIISIATPIDFVGDSTYIEYVFGGKMWFLKYLFACIIFACLSKLLFRNTLLAALLPAIVMISVSRVGLVRIYPFLWLGFCFNHYKDVIYKHAKTVLWAFFAAFAILLCFWDLEYDYPLYRWITISHGVSFDWFSFCVVTYRFLVGASGSLFFIVLFKLFSQMKPCCFSKITSKIGKRTLGIYCFQIYLLEDLSDYFPALPFDGVALVVCIISIAVLELALCASVTALLEKNKYTALFFLGHKSLFRK